MGIGKMVKYNVENWEETFKILKTDLKGLIEGLV